MALTDASNEFENVVVVVFAVVVVFRIQVPAREPKGSGSGAGDDDDDYSDMIHMPHMTASSVLKNIQKRYARRVTYTAIGSILLALNPYEVLDVYGDKYLAEYR